jgi:PIN domain nuclease of toxin-antitoxin system
LRVLLDTAPFPWLANGTPALSSTAWEIIEEPRNEVSLSAVSAWEIAIKHALGKLRLGRLPDELIPEARTAYAIQPLALDEESHCKRAAYPVSTATLSTAC